MDVQSITQLVTPVLKKYRVVRASVFGSAARGELKNISDVDILVELPHDVHGFDYVALRVDLREELESILGRRVDLVEFDLVKPELKQYIFPTQLQIL